MFERYRGPLLAGLIFAAFLIAFLALIHPRAFAQTMGEYGNVLSNSSSDSFKPLQVHPSQGLRSHANFQSDMHAKDSAKDFKPPTDSMKSNTFKAGKDFDTQNDFKTGSDFKSSDSFKPSFRTN